MLVVGVLAVVGILVLVAALLLKPAPPADDSAAQPTVAPSSAAPSPTESTASEAPSPTPTPTAPPADEQTPPPPSPEQRAVETVTGYYALLPGDLDGAWPLMTADYQENHAGGRGAYESFWAAVSDLEITDVTAPAPDQAQATLIYHFRDGRVVQEVTAYQLVDEGGVLKIAASDVLSSTEL
jgi:hypothetical protein